jgi:deoxyribose-phosphate aldolase
MLEAVFDHGSGGFKASGGIRTAEEAAAYLELADALFGPGWASPRTFRFGASSLLTDLLRER